ncbi:hypothetical protein HDU76_009211 [Blyttiomyces sp. JEL0837]|nr:hypothetical protein HDU76_009211 [Blyttiomyces sp. JEL0837]
MLPSSSRRPDRKTHLLEWALDVTKDYDFDLPPADANDEVFESFTSQLFLLAKEDAEAKNEKPPGQLEQLALRKQIRDYRQNPVEFTPGFPSGAFGQDSRRPLNNNGQRGFQQRTPGSGINNNGPRKPSRPQPYDWCPRHPEHTFRECPERAEIDSFYDSILYGNKK